MGVWKPRASSLGGYIECDFRAMLDRAIEEGVIVLPAAEKDDLKRGSKYTTFGTVCHFYLQDGIGCKFPGPNIDFAPTLEEETEAAGMCGGDVAQMRLKAREVSTLAAKHMPIAPDNKPWRAEIPYGKEPTSTLPFSGTVDFISHDGTVIGDLKTTSRPPEKNRVKTSHLIQLIAYHILTGAKKGFVLYVSSKGDWVMEPVWIDFAVLGDYVDMVKNAVQRMLSPDLYQTAMPRMLDERCGDHFCPHTGRCRDIIRPGAGTKVDTTYSLATVPIRAVSIFGKKAV